MKLANSQQIRHIHIHKSKLQMDDETYRGLIYQFTDGRATSSKDMSQSEAADLLDYFNGTFTPEKRAQTMRRKIMSYCHQMLWYIEGTQKIDYKRLDEWCIKFGHKHKKLNDYTYKELPTLISQFQNVFAHKITRK